MWLGAVGTSAQAQGVSGYTEVTGAAVTVPGFTSATGSATCPAGDVVLSGGYTLVGGNMVIDTSAPLGANGAISSTTWTVTGFDNGDGQGTFTPYAICGGSSIAGYSEASKAQSVNAGSLAQLTETCPAGSVITGGGFAAGSTAPVIDESDPTSSSNVSSTTWTVFVDNSGSRTAQSVTTYVVCVSNTISGYSEQLAQSSTAGVVSATCPSGSLVIGGGVFAPGPPNTSVDAPVAQNAAGASVVSNTSWSVDAASTGGGVIGSIAICAAPVPTVNSLKPSNGPAAGGNTIAIVGSNFTGATAVNFGSTPATSFSVVSSGQINAVVPAGSGAIDVTVTTPGGTSPTVSGDIYKYVPSVTSVSPTSGPTTGGTTVTINGTGFTGATGVSFGGTAATFLVKSSSQISATAPAGAAGTVDITVTTPGGTSTTGAADKYAYTNGPSVAAISPTSGPTAGGTSVTITGANLANATTVKFGSNPATISSNTATQIVAIAPAGSAGAVDVTVTAASGTSATSAADRYTYASQPTVTGVSPASGPTLGGTVVTITGTNLANPSAVKFGGSSAASVTPISATQIIAVSPAGTAGAQDVRVTTPGGTSAANQADQFTYSASKTPASPVVLTGAPSVHGSSAAALEGSVNPQGLPTTAHYEYGLDSKFRAAGPVYDQSTPSTSVGSDFTSHTVTASLSGLVPNALYHVRLVATNSAGTTFGPDATFSTTADPPPPPPKLGGSFNAQPVNGVVLVEINGKFIPLTEVRQIPNGAIINALHGTLVLITATNGNGPANISQAARSKHKKSKAKVRTQKGTFGGAVFKVTQDHSGLATLSLVEGASFPGAPTFASCTTHSGKATVAALSKKTLQLLHGSDNHGKFRTKGRYAAATVRGTVWSIADRCDGTLTHVARGTVVVSDLVRHKTITVRAGQSYLALARPPKHK